jgi:hypothetical protein
MIITAVFAPDFTLYEYPVPVPNWGVQIARNKDDWLPDCAEAFNEAVVRARRKFDIAWPL